MNDIVVVYMASGFAFLAAFGVLFSKRLALSAFSLFGLTIALALIFGSMDMPMAFVAQLILYVGGVMVLVLFALFLYGEPLKPEPWSKLKTNWLKTAALVLIFGLFAAKLPWQKLLEWSQNQPALEIEYSGSLAETGKWLATNYVLEFELLGIILLASILVAGWFIHSPSESSKS